MTHSPEIPAEAFRDEPDTDLDRQLDHIVDTEGLSYADARRKLGIEEESAADVVPEVVVPVRPTSRVTRGASSEARSRRARAASGPQYGEEAGVGYDGGVPFEHQPHVPWSDEQRATNQRGLALARATLAARRNQR